MAPFFLWIRPLYKYFACGWQITCAKRFFKNCLPWGFWAGCIVLVLCIYIFLNCIFKSRWDLEEQHILEIQKWSDTTKKLAEIASLQKLRTMEEITPDALCWKFISSGLHWDIWPGVEIMIFSCVRYFCRNFLNFEKYV